MVLIETHLKLEDTISIDGYKVCTHNRLSKHFNARRNFGGLAVLFKNRLFKEYEITELDKTIDGIYVFKLTNVHSQYRILFIAMYLPPERSPWGRNADIFFEHITNISHLYSSECDVTYMCGDVNARIGNKQDFINGIDQLLPRNVLDETCNKHGEALLEFLIENKLCIVNGRINNEESNDNFTFVSTRGRSVVDYFIVSVENLETCANSMFISQVFCLTVFVRVKVSI